MDPDKVMEVPAKRMTAEEILANPKFEELIQATVNKINNRPELKVGMKYTSNTFSDLIKAKGFTKEFVLSEFALLCDKKSRLSRKERDLIEDIVVDAAKRIVFDGQK